MRYLQCGCLCVAILALFGCGGEDHGAVPIRIHLTYNGSTVDGAIVILTSDDGGVSNCITNAKGVGVFETLEGWDGAMPGEYAVAVSKPLITFESASSTAGDPERTQVATSKQLLPEKYSSTATSGLRVVVSKANPVIEIDLKD